MEGIYAYADHIKIIKAVLDATQEIQHYLRYNSVNLLKTKNPFGKQQSDIDLKANEIVFKHMKNSGVIHAAISEETPEVSLKYLGIYLLTCRKQSLMRMESTSLPLIPLMARVSLTPTSPSDRSLASGALLTSSAKLAERWLEHVLPATEQGQQRLSITSRLSTWKSCR